jgi:hypothetical protein
MPPQPALGISGGHPMLPPPAMDQGDPTANSVSAAGRTGGRGMKLAVALVVALAILAPLAALLLKWMSSRDDRVEPPAPTDVTSVPQPPKTDTPPPDEDKDKPAAQTTPGPGDKSGKGKTTPSGKKGSGDKSGKPKTTPAGGKLKIAD